MNENTVPAPGGEDGGQVEKGEGPALPVHRDLLHSPLLSLPHQRGTDPLPLGYTYPLTLRCTDPFTWGCTNPLTLVCTGLLTLRCTDPLTLGVKMLNGRHIELRNVMSRVRLLDIQAKTVKHKIPSEKKTALNNL